ncbi:hypothetical protein [Streptomyces rhizosphaerihabitans]|uniref:hypothetical protein n=1 Tax=Streptomyces rhizosphaerihabitans TaxID=1266770 RepID=UPI0021C1470C|nr:hypothetical protein [Streptomyces rhizosphaerihabitans]MCT9010577.1 hypothetical protein [Streptomyces rhizosphaerihabitans]
MYYREMACDIQIAAQAGGAALVVPPYEVCEHTVRQFEGRAEGDLHDNAALELAWTTMLRLPDRIAPDYRD